MPSSLRVFFEPRVVAVVGAGRSRGHVGAEILHNLLSGGFGGRVVAVNPHAGAVQGVECFARTSDIPGPVDLAIIAVPTDAVETALDDCLRKQVAAAVVITAGFGETGPAGLEREHVLRDKARAGGLRLIGPNCLGLLNTDPAVRLNATFSPVFPPPGPIAFSSQSGALGLAVLDYAARLGFGISQFASIGNKADVSSNDLLELWEHDPRTSVILLYLESFGNPRRFSRIARRVSQHKPILAVKAGRSAAGARAASSHTGALAARDAVVDALFRDAGVIRTETLEELFDGAMLLAHQPLPAGPRVAILTNAGGPGIMAADACEALGLTVPPLEADTIAALRAFLPATANATNPVDMIATAPADHYRRALPLLLADPNIDSVLAIFIPPLVTHSEDVARALADAARGSTKPVLATLFGAPGAADILGAVPCYAFPESAVRALAHATWYSRWRSRPPAQEPAITGTSGDVAAGIIDAAAATGGGWLPPEACAALLAAAGIATIPTHAAVAWPDVVAAARALGFPVALKGSGPAITHKTEAHAVHLDLADEGALRRAFDALQRPDIEQLVVQRMAPAGVETIVGATRDPTFGQVVVCGSGGTLVEVLRDTSCRLAPVTDRGARDMVDELRGAIRLRGFRGAPPADEAALRQVILRVSWLVERCPAIAEMDLNPVLVTESGAVALDARVRVDAAVTQPAREPRAAC